MLHYNINMIKTPKLITDCYAVIINIKIKRKDASMKKNPGIMAVILFVTGLLSIGALFYAAYSTYVTVASAEKELAEVVETIRQKQLELSQDEQIFSEAIATARNTLTRRNQKALTASQVLQRERAPGAEDSQSSAPSVFSQTDQADSFGDMAENGGFGDSVSAAGGAENSGAAVPEEAYGATEEDGMISPPRYTSSAGGEENFAGHIVGIDPGHQSYSVDMSDQEPLGPGSSEMKAKASTGTEGVYTGLPEYQLNLDVSLKLRDILEDRGYQVVMTRTDNDTAISNKERAQYVAEMGAEIYVRIHANGEESRTVSGALGMAPSPDNPYVGELSEQSQLLSQCILDSYCEATEFKNLGVDFYDNMTGINWSTVPVTILEMGFMTFESDDRQMSDEAFQEKMAEGIADGIDEYFRESV